MATAGFFVLPLYKEHYDTVHNRHREGSRAMTSFPSHGGIRSRWCAFTSKREQLQRLRRTNLWGLSKRTWSTQQHIIASEPPPRVLPKTGCCHTSLTESASRLFSVCVISEPPQPQLTAAQASLPGTKGDSTKRKGKGGKKMQKNFSFSYSWLYQHSQSSSQQSWAKRPLQLWMQKKCSVLTKKGVFLCTQNILKEPLVPL